MKIWNNGGVWFCLAAWMLLNGCVENIDVEDFSTHRVPLTAKCTIYVNGYGAVDMETDYVPNVTACENGGAGTEGLKAQAIAARTFGYYKLNNGMGTSSNPVNNSQGDQVYKCSYTTAADKHYAATNDTSGVVLTYKNVPICSFYVSGVTPSYLNSECKWTGTSSDTGYVSQQKYVTYNYGKTGSSVTQSSLGWVNAANNANRGCMSQNGAKCLSNAGKDYKYILQFFYGSDIGFTQAEGSCVANKVSSCETVIDRSGVVIEETDNCFTRSTSSSWYELSKGSGSHLYYTYVWAKDADVVGTWKLNVTRPGKYVVEAYIQPDVGAMSEKAPYTIRANGVETKLSVNLSGKSGWVSLGAFDFVKGSDQFVRLTDASGEPYTDTNGKRILFDAIRLTDAVTCTDACTAGAKECSGNGYRTCTKGSEGCTVWSAVTACGADQKCSAGACVDVQTCTDACTEGAKECSGNGYRTCAKGSDGCTSWSAVTPCGNGMMCSNGSCQEQCSNECTKGESECVGESAYRACDMADGCLKWTDARACAEGYVCDDGKCIERVECEDECVVGSTSCIGNNVRFCEQNVLGCGVWRGSRACEGSRSCVDGECVDDPSKETTDNPWTGRTDDMPESCLTEIDGRPSVIIDDLDACFVRASSSRWSEAFNLGYDGHLYYAYITQDMPSAVATWHLNVTKAGKYTIYAYIDSLTGTISRRSPYIIRANGHKMSYTINQAGPTGWYRIDDVDLVEGKDQYVQLMDSTSEVLGTNQGRRVIYDAIQIVPFGTTVHGVVDPSEIPSDDAAVDVYDPDKDNDNEMDDGEVGGSASSEVAEASCAFAGLRHTHACPWLILLAGGTGMLALRRKRRQKTTASQS